MERWVKSYGRMNFTNELGVKRLLLILKCSSFSIIITVGTSIMLFKLKVWFIGDF